MEQSRRHGPGGSRAEVADHFGTTTQTAVLRDGVSGLVAMATGLRLRLPTRAPWASVLATAVGILLVSRTFPLDGRSGYERVNDLFSGALILAAGIAALFRPAA